MAPILLGVGLGGLALVADLLADKPAAFVAPIASTGFGWGLCALLAGLLARGRRKAVPAGVATLGIATITYYALTVVTSPRWDLKPEDVEGGRTGASFVLASVGPALALWSAVALCGGAIMGFLGHIITSTGTTAATRHASIAAGVAFGLLAGEGVYVLFHTVFIWAAPIDSFVLNKVFSATTQLVLATIAVVLILWLRKQGRSWQAFGVAAVASTAVNIVFWHVLQTARMLV